MSKIFERRLPVFLSQPEVRTIHPGGSRATQTTPPVVQEKLKLMGYLFYTWNVADPLDWSVSTLSGVPFRRGWNYASKWRAFFQARGLTVQQNGTGSDWNGTAHVYEYTSAGIQYVQLRGIGVFHWGSANHYTMYGHAPPVEHIAETKRLSVVGTKVGVGLLNFESVNMAVDFSTALHQLRLVSRNYILPSDNGGCGTPGLNSYGCTGIDKYECDPVNQGDIVSGTFGTCSQVWRADSVACPHTPAHAGLPAFVTDSVFGHTMDCDVRSGQYIIDLAGTTKSTIGPEELEGLGPELLDPPPGFEWQIWDNMGLPYKGTALNNFPASYTSAAYVGTRSGVALNRSGWKGFMQQLQLTYSHQAADFIWANCHDSTEYYSATDCRNRWVEYFFAVPGSIQPLDTIANIRTRVTAAKAAGLVISMNVQPGATQPWATATGPGGVNGTWVDLMAHIRAQDAVAYFVVMASRDDSYMFWQEGFSDLV